MKRKNVFKAVLFTATCAAIISCGTASGGASAGGGGQGAKSSPESGFTIAAQKTFVRDWQGRTLNEVAVPAWLGAAMRGDFSSYQSAFNVRAGNEIYRTCEATGADVRAATMRADMAYARKIARELQQSISVYAAESARAGKMSETTAQAIQEKTKTESHVDITGHQKKTEFWQLLETEDAATGKMEKNYIVYQVYAINPQAWMQTTAKYIKEVLGADMPALSREGLEVNNMIDTMMNDARYPTVLTQEQARNQIEAEKRMVDVQANLAPAQQKAAAQQELARIAQSGRTERTQITADASTAQVQALADAQQTAYASGNPVLTSAATTTAADADWVNARALAASILF